MSERLDWVLLCEDTGELATEGGACPNHGGDSCLALYAHPAMVERYASTHPTDCEYCTPPEQPLTPGSEMAMTPEAIAEMVEPSRSRAQVNQQATEAYRNRKGT